MSQETTLLDRAIAWVSPERGVRRMASRRLMASYNGALPTRVSSRFEQSTSATGQRVPTLPMMQNLRDRARHLERNNPVASGILDRVTENVIGTGIQIEPATSDEDFNTAVSDWWEGWKERCDVTGRFSFDRLQRMTFRSMLRDGDIGTVLVDAYGVGKLQAIEGDYITSPPGKMMGGLTVDGVELDRVGAFSRFWVRSVDEKYKPTFTAVQARDFIFLPNIDRISDIRGTTNFRQDFDLFDMIHGYLENTVAASSIATLFALLIKQDRPMAGPGAMPPPTVTNSVGEQQRVLNMESAMVKYLKTGETVEQVKPEQPTQQFPEAIAAFARFVGLKWGLPLEEVLLDYSRANYTVSRAIKMKIQRVADIWQQDFAHQYVSRVYRWALSKAIKNGEISVAPPQDSWKHEWLPQPLALTDPVKEIAAAAAAIELGIDARTYVARGYGYKLKDVVRQNVADRKLMAENGLPIDGPQKVPPPPPPVDPTDDDPPPTDENTPSGSRQGPAVRKLLAMLPEHLKDNP
jgi:lambda family phage portal protein